MWLAKVAWVQVEDSVGSVEYEEDGLVQPVVLVAGLQPGASYRVTLTSNNKKASKRFDVMLGDKWVLVVCVCVCMVCVYMCL